MPSRLRSTVFVMSVLPLIAACSPPPASDRPPQPGLLSTVASGPTDLYVSPTGSDSNPGTAPDRPLRLVATAAEKAGPGTTVHLAEGTYHEQLVTRRAGLPGHAITFTSDAGMAILDGSRLPWQEAGNQNQGLVELRHPYVRLVGLKVLRSKNSGIVLDADHLTVEGCEIAEVQRHAISTDTGRQTAAGRPMIQDVTLEGNLVHDATLAGSGYGQAISLIADGFVIRGNRVHANRDIGIDVWLGASHGEVAGNIVYNNGSTGIYVDGASYVRIHGNTVHDNRHGIILSSEDHRYRTHHVWVYNNLVYDQRAGGGCGTWDPDIGVQDCVFAFNTLVNNLQSFRLAGFDNTVELANNLGYAYRDDLINKTSNSIINNHDNVWLPYLTGFRSVTGLDFRLTASSPGLDRGKPLAAFRDDRGQVFAIGTDFAGQPRRARLAPDAGALELP